MPLSSFSELPKGITQADVEAAKPYKLPELPDFTKPNVEIAQFSPEVQKAAKELASRTLARRSLLHFTRKTHPSYDAGWVHADICRRLERFSREVVEKKSPRLMLLMPPRGGKSELASIRFPAWHLGQYPAHEIVDVSYNLDLPMRFSRKVRELLRDPVYSAIFPNTKLDPDSQSLETWNTTGGGGFMAVGVGGGLTGKGAHILIVDDPIKNQEEADSQVTRDALWDWYQSTAYTRLAPGGGVLIIETWWNDDDLAGRVLNAMRDIPGADQFDVVKYPALAEQWEFRHKDTLEIRRVGADLPDDTETALQHKAAARAELSPPEWELLRKPGEALHPERYDVSALTRIKTTLSARIWSALYQQNPIPDSGLYFRKEYLRYAPVVPDIFQRNVYTAWDFAIGVKQSNDYTVGATFLQDFDDNLYLIDVQRFKDDSFAIVERMLDVAERFGSRPDVSYLMGVEDGQIWQAIRPTFLKRAAERKLYPSYEALKPLTDKMARARNLQGRFQQRKIWFPGDPAAQVWLKDVEHELLRFPGGAHDDIVDAMAWAVNLLIGKSAPAQRMEHERPRTWKEKLEEQLNMLSGSHMSA